MCSKKNSTASTMMIALTKPVSRVLIESILLIYIDFDLDCVLIVSCRSMVTCFNCMGVIIMANLRKHCEHGKRDYQIVCLEVQEIGFDSLEQST